MTEDRSSDMGESREPSGAGAPSLRPKRRLPAWARWAIEISLFILVYWGVSLYQTRGAFTGGNAFGEMRLNTVRGEVVDFAAYRGRPILVHVWATWCSVCKREFSAVRSIASAPPADAVVLTIVADGEDRAYLQRFVQDNSLSYPVLIGSDAVMKQLGVSAYPTSYYIARDGSVGSVTAGMSTRWAMWLRLWWVS